MSPLPSASVCAVALLVALSPGLRAQVEAPGHVPPSFRLDQWTTADGLPSNFVVDIARAPDGPLLLLVSGEVLSFDGVQFRTLPAQTDSSGPTGPLRGMAIGAADTLWLTTPGGEVVSLAKGRLRVEARTGRMLWDVDAGPDGRVVVASGEGLVMERSDGFRPRAVGPTFRGTGDGGRYGPEVALARRPGAVWVNATSGTFLLDKRGLSRMGPGLDAALVRDARTGDVLVPKPSAGGLDLVTPDGIPVARVPAGVAGEVRAVDRRGRVWIVDGRWLAAYEPGSSRPVAKLALPPDTRIERVLMDEEGNLWLTTARSGFLRVREVPFFTVGPTAGLPGGALAVAVGPKGGTRVLGYDGTVYRVDGGRGVPVFRSDAADIAVDGEGTIWLPERFVEPGSGGKRVYGLIAYRRDGDTAFVRTPGSVAHVAVDLASPWNVWASGQDLYRIDTRRAGGGSVAQVVRLPDMTPPRMSPDPRGGVWVSGAKSTARVDETGLERVPLPDEGVGARIRAVVPDGLGGLWIGTYGAGLVHWRDGKLTRITTANGLGEDVIATMAVGEDGRLWMGGNQSIHAVPLDQLTAFVEGRRGSVDGIAFGEADGLPRPEATGNLVATGVDGRLWFPTFGGLATVNPSTVDSLFGGSAPVRIVSVRVGDSLVGPGPGEIHFPRGVRDVEVTFTTTALANAGRMRFEYRMSDLDQGWRRAGTDRTARYLAVPGGAHRFEVRAMGPLGAWSAKPAVLDLRVPRRFTETVWFPLLLMALLVVAATAGVRIRTRHAEARSAALEALVGQRTTELQDAKGEVEAALEVVSRQRAELEVMDAAKDRFFANVTHELRTPLTLLLGPLRDLRSGRLGTVPEDAVEEMRMAEANGQRLLELVDQLLEVARLEAGHLPLRPQPGALRDFLGRILERCGRMARECELTWHADVGGTAQNAVFDGDALEKIVVNLVANALKFTPPGGSVRVSASTRSRGDGLELELAVADSGEGIPPEEIDHIFERFVRVDERRGTKVPGTGLGLALVRELVELMDGEIRASSPPGGGTKFTARVPVGRAESDGDTRLGLDRAEPDAEPLVLVVEDNPDLRRYLRRNLEPEYRVVEAEDGGQGLELARIHAPDAVVSDIMMPGMDGEELCRRLKGDPELNYVPVILLTARATREDRISGLRQGADAYLAKPFSVEELLLTLGNQVAARRRFRERMRQEGASSDLLLPWEGKPRGEDQERFVADLHQAVAEHIGEEELDPERLAKAMFMSRSTLYRRVREVVGMSPMDVVWEFRLQQARAWLAETGGTVAEVAYAVGFKSVSHFTRRYRERFGETPSSRRDG